MGQGAKPGIGGHLTGSKIVEDVSRTRMIPMGTDAISPAPHHDIYSIEDLRQLVYSLKEETNYKKPIIVKIAAVHNVAAIASGIARSGADIIAIDGFRAGTGAAPTRIRDNVGIPIELALAAVDQRLRDEGIRGDVSIIASGTIHNSADIVKAIALGADAVYIATAAMLAMGCHMCRTCQIGKCNWGIATQRPDLVARLDPIEASRRLVNLVNGWNHEIMEMMGGMGINSIEALRGNRLMLRGGKIFVKGSIGYRAGIHMKAYREKVPKLVVGGVAGSFLGEYQAGGTIVVLGIHNPMGLPLVGRFCGTGMHGGKMFLRMEELPFDLPPQVCAKKAEAADLEEIRPLLDEYCEEFGGSTEEILNASFYVLTPNTDNPYKALYTQNN